MQNSERFKHIRHVVGVCGPLHSGKTAVALRLKEKHEFTRTRIADRLKRMLHAMGIPWEYIDGDKKHEPLEILGGRTSRYAMQKLGSEWGRHLIHSDVWVFAWQAELWDLHLQTNYKTYDIVVDDLRFPNEAVAIKGLNGTIIRVNRPGHEHDQSHESEAHVLDADIVIENDGTLDELHVKVDEIYASLVRSHSDG